MSEFKFACPVCGQHISCDTTRAGSQMQCPTCFQMLTVPQSSVDRSSKYILTASKVQPRPIPPGVETAQPSIVKKKFPAAAIALAIILCVIGVSGFLFRDKILSRFEKSKHPPIEVKLTTPPAENVALASGGANWTLNLEGVALPDSPVRGIVHGKPLNPERMVLDGGTLTLRTSNPGPPDVGVSIYLNANRSEELAGRTISIAVNSGNAPWVNLRWNDAQSQAMTETVKNGYAMRIEFGSLAGNHLPGKIYLCTPDETKSFLAGTFNAEILKSK